MGRHRVRRRPAPRHVRRVGRRFVVGLLTLTGLGLCAVVPLSSQAAFSGTTTDGSSHLAAGTVVIGDDGAGSAIVPAGGLAPGDSDTSCVGIRYSGGLAAQVRLYAQISQDTGVSPYISVTVDQGTSGPAAGRDCTTSPGFGGTVTAVGSATAADLPTAYGSGLVCWTANPGDTRWFRIRYQIEATMPESQQGNSAAVALIWEAQDA